MSRMLGLSTEVVDVVLEVPDDAPVRLARLTAPGSCALPAHAGRLQPLVELLVLGDGHMLSNTRFSHTAVGDRLRLVDHEEVERHGWRELRVRQRDASTGLETTSVLSVHPRAAAVRAWTEVHHTGVTPMVLQAVTSLASAALLEGQEDAGDLVVWRARGDWCAEDRWVPTPVRSRDGLADINTRLHEHDGRGTFATTSHSTWSSGEFLPTAVLENTQTGRAWAWQVEHNGAWRWELDSRREGLDALSLAVMGPNDVDHAWSHLLAPGETFTSVPVTVAVAGEGGLQGALAALTDHRRTLRHLQPGDADLPLVFNDYMNTLMGDPTTAKLLPLVDAAADSGAEIFCIDAGWYDDGGHWWDSVGEWQPSTGRFPDGGLERVLGHIRARGMGAGLWLEPEVIGVRSPMAAKLPDAAFLQRYGQRVVEHSRYHLDLRHPAAREHLDAVVDHLVDDLGVVFFKLDYNITPGAGTDLDALSPGDGLLQHNRAHLDWLDAVLARHPQVVFENCSSGAMRMDYAMLSRLAFQSTSDQQDGLLYAAIAAAAPASLLPEQAGNWAYPQHGDALELSAFTLLNGLAGRLYLSGHLDHFDPEELDLVREAVAVHKDLRGDLSRSRPFWPLGLPAWDDDVVCLGLRLPSHDLVHVWSRRGSTEEVALHLPHWRGRTPAVETLFPTALPAWAHSWDVDAALLTVHPLPGVASGRLLRLS